MAKWERERETNPRVMRKSYSTDDEITSINDRTQEGSHLNHCHKSSSAQFSLNTSIQTNKPYELKQSKGGNSTTAYELQRCQTLRPAQYTEKIIYAHLLEPK